MRLDQSCWRRCRNTTVGDADGELEGPVDGSDLGPEEGALFKLPEGEEEEG